MIEIALTALFLGLKHSFDADHLIAVSNFLTPLKSLKSAFNAAFSWAMGHMLTAALITFLLFYFRETILSNFLKKFELIAAVMLVVLGILSLMRSRILHSHGHGHENLEHNHVHMHLANSSSHLDLHERHSHLFGIGIIHGLASNDELLLLLVVSMGLTGLAEMIFGVGVFSIGVMIGMISYSAFFTLPLIKANSEKIRQIASILVGMSSIFYGITMLL